jgi:hypothetical protein
VAVDRPAPAEFAPRFAPYLEAVPDGDVLDRLARQGEEARALLAGFGEEGARRRYAPGKWSVKQVAGHLADVERVFAHRALAFARGDAAALPGMDEDAWADAAGHDAVPLSDLLEELAVVRRATLLLFRPLDAAALLRRGIADGNVLSVRAVPWLLAGHERHHAAVLRERYR